MDRVSDYYTGTGGVTWSGNTTWAESAASAASLLAEWQAKAAATKITVGPTS